MDITSEYISNPLIASVEIVKGPEQGSATVNADNTITLLVPGGYSSSFSFEYTVTFSSGETGTFAAELDTAALHQGTDANEPYTLALDGKTGLVLSADDMVTSDVVSMATSQMTTSPDASAALTDAVSLTGDASVSVEGGRVTTFELDTEQPILSCEITDGPEFGNVTVNPDNSVALVLSGSDYSGPLTFSYTVTYESGETASHTVSLDVSPPAQDAGWGEGKHYMLEVDANGDLVVETGEAHRKVYVSGSDDALTWSDIAALEGVDESTITTYWLLEHAEYGGSEDMALATDIGMETWYALTPKFAETSNWLLFEKGYDYSDTGQLIQRGVSGESPLHPTVIGSWGAGTQPVLEDMVNIWQAESNYIVFDDIELAGGFQSLNGSNIILNEVTSDGKMVSFNGLDQTLTGITLRNSQITEAVEDTPEGEFWVDPKEQGLFTTNVDGLLIDGSVFYHNAWEDDYEMDGATTGGMLPTKFNHNIYLQIDTLDVTMRDSISAQGASYGAQFRGGAFVENSVFLDNNAQINFNGNSSGGEVTDGNFSFMLDNVITSAGHKDTDFEQDVGAKGWGIDVEGYQTSFYQNVIAHGSDPNNADEVEAKDQITAALVFENDEAYFNDTIIFNWGNSADTAGVDEAAANNTTIQLFTEALLGSDANTITDLMEYIVSQDDVSVFARDIVEYFQSGFGITTASDDSQTTHRFIPDDLADGIRWDNRINWDSEELPTTGDNVDLGGNWVQYGSTTQLTDLHLGTGGALYVNSGKLTVTGEMSIGSTDADSNGTGMVQIENAGQFWMNGYSGSQELTIAVENGRFANTGDVSGATFLHATDGQVILATGSASYTLTNGSELRIEGSDVQVGFDGPTADEDAALIMDDGSLLTFDSDTDGFSMIGEFRSGAWDQDSTEVTSSVSLDGTLKIDLSDYVGSAATHSLIEVDTLTGLLDDIEITGLGSGLDAFAIIDYDADTVVLNITSGTGQTGSEIIGDGWDETLNTEDPGTLYTGTGQSEYIEGGEGNSTIRALDGNDRIWDQGGDNLVDGGAGNDRISTNSGSDTVEGGSGTDSIMGFAGDDSLSGDGGNDTVWGGSGDDYVSGGDGKDRIGGAEGADVIDGGAGNDTIYGDEGDDIGNGGDGQDEVWMSHDNDTVYGGADNDSLGGGDGDDLLFGEAGDDLVYGGKNNDIAHGDGGNDTVWAGSGQDQVYGGDGDDVVGGGDGNDIVYGGNGHDRVWGGIGDDYLYGDAGDDTITGEAGADIFVFSAGHGVDRITDFTIGEDVINLDFAGAAFEDLIIEESETHTLVSTGEGTITLLDVNPTDLSQLDFLF